MRAFDWLAHTSSLSDYQRQAEALLDALRSGDEEARATFKWEHPRFHGRPVADVDPARLDIDDAKVVVAHRYAFETWSDLAEFAEAVVRDSAVAHFEAAVEAVISGQVTTLRAMLSDHPELARARSRRRHHATLLHYVSANGVEGGRQRTPQNAVEVAAALLDAGAEVDATAEMYEGAWTTLSLLVSSAHPARAGLQAILTETLLDHGATFTGHGSNQQSVLMTALAFGYLPTAQALEKRGAPADNLAIVAGLGRHDDAARLLVEADVRERHIALALAAQHGHASIVQLLLDAGEDPSRYNPDGHHPHSTPLHQAVWSNHADVVALLVTSGASLDMRDTIYGGTPLDWAIHGGRAEIADYLRRRPGSTT